MNRRVTKRELAYSLQNSGRTVNEIASILEVPPGAVEVWMELPSSDLYADAKAQNNVARRFSGILRYRDVPSAEGSVARIDALWREFVEAGDLRGQHQAQLMALVGKNRAEAIGKETCARLFGDWLIAHMWPGQ